MKTNKSNWRLNVSISKLPKMLLAFAFLMVSSISSAQTLDLTLTPYEWTGGVNVRCNGQNSGRITAVVTGGVAPYTYDWSAGIPVAGGTISVGLYAGNCTLTVTDAAGTSVTDSVTLTEPSIFLSTTSWSPILCHGGTSTVTTSGTGGTAPYNGITSTIVSAGTYEYILADANGCRAFDTISISQPDLLDVTATPDPILCFGDSTTVDVVGIGGTFPYVGTGSFEVVAGTYTYDIVDANGCSETTTLAVNQPGQLTAMVSNTPILCNGGLSQVTVTVASGTEPYTGTGIYWESAGTYTYTVYDYNLCQDEISITITEPSQMVSTLTATPILCNGGTTTITATGTGGTGAWTGTGTVTATAGTYDYLFTDANGCVDSNSITVSEPTLLMASATVGTYSCVTGTAPVTVSATGGTPSYSGIGTFDEVLGSHTFTVTDANGCTATAGADVVEGPTASITISGVPSDATVECDAVPTPANVTATDANGDNVSVAFTETTTGSGCSYQIVRTWTATDLCGNQETETQTLTVQDTQGPVIACPADYTIDCNNPFIPLNSVVVTATDCSNNITTSVSDSVVSGAAFASQTTIYRTITASDDCGNTSTCTQVITGPAVMTEGECKKCDTEIHVVVDPLNPSCVYVESICKDLSNVVLGDINGWEYKFDGLNGYTGYFCHPSGLPVTDVWVKAGCYRSGDGPGYGHHFDLCGSGGPVGPVTYEPSAGLNTSYEWIQQVSLGSINNISGNDGGYGDYSTMATAPSLGDAVSLQLTPGFTGVSYDEYWRVWVDWNNDGDFVDAGEQVYQNNGTGVLNGSFTVPQTSLTDTDLKVRVAMKWDAYSAPNEMFQYGEVEDYTIYVQAGGIDGMQTTIGGTNGNEEIREGNTATASNEEVKTNEVVESVSNSGYGIELGAVYPNPVLSANGKFNLDIRTSTTDITVRIVDLSGRVVLTEEMYLGIGANKCQLDVTGFTAGSYLIEVLSDESKETTQLIVQ